MKNPKTINKLLDERISYLKEMDSDKAKLLLSKYLYCKSLDSNRESLEYRELVNSIIDEIIAGQDDRDVDIDPIHKTAMILYWADEDKWLEAIKRLKINPI